MSKRDTCWRCRKPVPFRPDGSREGPWELRGHWYCQPCITTLIADAEIVATNRALDEAMSRHARHVTQALDCSLCAYGLV